MSKPSEGQAFQNLQVFHDVARALTSSLDLNSVLAAIMKQAEQFFEPEFWSLLLVDEDQTTPCMALCSAKRDGGQAEMFLAASRAIGGWVVRHGEAVLAADTAQDARFAAAGVFGSFPVRSVMCVPLQSRDRVLGVIELLNCRSPRCTGNEAPLLHVLADYAAIAVQNAHAVEQIQELTITDDCTGLFNSRHLNSVLEGELERSRRFHLPFSLIFMDLDHFKWINDRHGHLVGSWVLEKVAGTIRHGIRGVDSAFRYGGDEFIILLPQTSKDAAIEVAHRLLHATRASSYARSENLAVSVRASFGLASYPDDGSTAHQIICAADQMMYLVKNSTRNNIAVAQRGILEGASSH
jgi:diguanylate cyclase (GGDEF)-like protein